MAFHVQKRPAVSVVVILGRGVCRRMCIFVSHPRQDAHKFQVSVIYMSYNKSRYSATGASLSSSSFSSLGFGEDEVSNSSPKSTSFVWDSSNRTYLHGDKTINTLNGPKDGYLSGLGFQEGSLFLGAKCNIPQYVGTSTGCDSPRAGTPTSPRAGPHHGCSDGDYAQGVDTLLFENRSVLSLSSSVSGSVRQRASSLSSECSVNTFSSGAGSMTHTQGHQIINATSTIGELLHSANMFHANQREHNSLQREHHSLQREHTRIQAKYDASTRAEKKMKHELARFEMENGRLQVSLDAFRCETEGKDQVIACLEAENEHLRAELASSVYERGKREQDFEDLTIKLGEIANQNHVDFKEVFVDFEKVLVLFKGLLAVNEQWPQAHHDGFLTPDAKKTVEPRSSPSRGQFHQQKKRMRHDLL